MPDFNPRFPRGKRHQLPHLLAGGLHISIHASRGGSDFFEIGGLPFDDISIHASRGGSDQEPKQGDAPAGISIHASRGGSDLLIQWDVRRHPDFNPRFPRGKRQHSLIRFPKSSISIHASRGGSDKMTKFYDGKKTVISIHASRGGSDIKLTLVGIIVGNFNPRFPRGKRQSAQIIPITPIIFQSTLPAGEATYLPCVQGKENLNFNPRFPRGKRPWEADKFFL